MKDSPYSSALGCLMYAMLFIRPDLSHAIGILSRYQKNPGEERWKQIKHVMCYVMSKEPWIIHCVLTVIIFNCRVILMLIGKGIWMTGNLRQVIYSLWQEVLFLGVAGSKIQLLFRPWKLNILLHLTQQRKEYG